MSQKHSFTTVPFSTRLTLMRVGRRMSQAELAKSVEIDQAIISRYENGLAPSTEHVEKFEDFFGVEFDHPKVEEAVQIFSGTYPFPPEKKLIAMAA